MREKEGEIERERQRREREEYITCRWLREGVGQIERGREGVCV